MQYIRLMFPFCLHLLVNFGLCVDVYRNRDKFSDRIGLRRRSFFFFFFFFKKKNTFDIVFQICLNNNILKPCFNWTKIGMICVHILHFYHTCMTPDTTENLRAPPIRHHDIKWHGVFSILK